MINLAGLTVETKTKGKSKEKPALPDSDGTLAAHVTSGIEAKQNVNAWDAAMKGANAALGEAAVKHAFTLYHGRQDGIEDTFQVVTTKGKALVSLKNAYKVPEKLEKVRELLGSHADRFIRQSHTLEIDLDAMPEFLVQTFIDELVALAVKLEEVTGSAEGAVKGAITVKPEVKIAKSFHEERHALFTPEQNEEIHKHLPCVVSVRYDF